MSRAKLQTEFLHVRMSKAQAKRIEEIMAVTKMNRSQIVRQLISNAIMTTTVSAKVEAKAK